MPSKFLKKWEFEPSKFLKSFLIYMVYFKMQRKRTVYSTRKSCSLRWHVCSRVKFMENVQKIWQSERRLRCERSEKGRNCWPSEERRQWTICENSFLFPPCRSTQHMYCHRNRDADKSWWRLGMKVPSTLTFRGHRIYMDILKREL